MSTEAIDAMFESMVSFIRRSIAKSLEADRETIASLERRLDALETAGTMKFLGPHNPMTARHQIGDVVQRSGSTWVALGETAELPGQSPMWRRIGTDR